MDGFRIDRRSLIMTSMLAGLGAACGEASAGRGSKARRDLYNCEGCEAVAERDPASLTWETRIAPPAEPGEPMRIEGRVFKADGHTPAPDVVIYAHQTNADGLYANGTNESEWSRRNGRLRGWVKTDAEGRYAFVTIKPAPYPDATMPAHVHLMVGEQGHRPYYIDDIVFDGEFGVTPTYRKQQELRGGSGIVRLERGADELWIARRDIVLEVHP